MSVGAVVLLVVSIVLFVAVMLVLGFLPFVRKGRAAQRALAAELQHEPPLRGPERATYRGSTGSYSQVMGNGTLVLTAQRIAFVKSTGGRVDVPLASVTRVDTMKVFRRSRSGGLVHLVVHTGAGAVGFFVTDLDAWVAAITTAAGLPA